MSRGRSVRVLVLVAAAVLAFPRAGNADEEFRFYGLQFGMTSKAAAAVAPFIEAQKGQVNVKSPGHGMVGLTLVFDREGLLMEMQASYPRPEDPLELEGVRRGLREKFLMPLQAGFKDITASLDEYANRAAFTLVMVSRTRREKNIEYYKGEFIKKLQAAP